MLRLPQQPTRTEVLSFISKSSSYGNLCAFIGAGLPMAVLNDDKHEIALSWGDLLKKASERMAVDFNGLSKVGLSFPDLASAICKVHSEASRIEYRKSLSRLKHEIASLTSWYPNQDRRKKFSKYFDCLSPSWIITTNYDLVIESLLTGKATPLGPNDPLSSPKGIIPVFHLHGIRTNPEEIIVAQEDYVSLFRPTEYRQVKLALTLKESTTLLIGYGLGDVNVLTALDWSRNVFKREQLSYPNDVIQVFKSANSAAQTPYRDRNKILIIEIDDLTDFFEEFIDVRRDLSKNEIRDREQLTTLAKKLDEPDHSMIDTFIDDDSFRETMLKTLSGLSVHQISGFVSFLDQCIDATWSRSAASRALEPYNQSLSIILDILTSFPLENFPPALFETAAYGLERAGSYVGDESGHFRTAKKTWDHRKLELGAKTVAELKSLARKRGYINLQRLTKNF